MRISILRAACATVLAGLLAGVVLQGQRVPQGGGAFLPGADYDLSGDVRFTNANLTNANNPVTLGATQTLTNKTLINPTLTGGTFAPTSLAVSGAGTGVATLTYANTSTSGTFTVPSSAGDTFVTLAATQTLTNKTLTSPTLTTPTLGAATATTVNKLTLTAPATAATLTIIDGTTITGPAATDTLVGRASTDTLTNKTLTAPVIASITNTGTLTMPNATGGLPLALNCGATGTGNQTCSPTAAAATTKAYAGTSTLASNAAVITFPTAFAATTSYQCLANDITTRANPVQMLSTSTTTATITNTTGASDVINWICLGQ